MIMMMDAIYYVKTDNCKIAGKYFVAWLFSDHYMEIEQGHGALDHLRQLRAEGKKVIKLYPDEKVYPDKLKEICSFWDIHPEELD